MCSGLSYLSGHSTGIIDFDSIFSLLRTAGFDGWVSIEDGVSGIEELQRSARFLLPYVNG